MPSGHDWKGAGQFLMVAKNTLPGVARPAIPKRRGKTQGPVERPVDFLLNLPQAKTAWVAGTFNKWEYHLTPMHREPNGGWKATVWLRPGRYEYRFVADGQWLSDSSAKTSMENEHGSTNSVVEV